MRYFRFIWFWIKNSFNLDEPSLVLFDYVDYIAEEKNHFVFSWKMENAFRIKIKSANFKSFLVAGSTYITLLEKVENLEVIISSSWKSRRYLVTLKHITLDTSLDFILNVRSSFSAEIHLMTTQPKISRFTINSFNAKLMDKKYIQKVINLSYPN